MRISTKGQVNHSINLIDSANMAYAQELDSPLITCNEILNNIPKNFQENGKPKAKYRHCFIY